MERVSFKVPGYDCVRKPCGKRGCGTDPGSSHGIRNEVWGYVVKNGDVALSLSVGSGIYLPSVPGPHWDDNQKPAGTDLSLHVAWQVTRQNVRDGFTGQECDYVTGGRCYQGGRFSTALGAVEFTAKHFVKAFIRAASFEQPESFWLALEAECERQAALAREERADLKYIK